ncbi:HAD-IA family hydrolase [Actinomadura rayongensis]|uniref:HAD-IA family hydrolase n=1 Tax=Actinomadura rayongensis TaxID=1429076 RepID=A0A6I4W947_9ACTN|nr:HAD-IA family hydrolase [Actinomadura rayongensis]
MAIEAVIFDWGGTLTPWHDVDVAALWRGACASSGLSAERLEEVAAKLHAAEDEVWRRSVSEHRSGTLEEVFALAGVEPTEALLAADFDAWTPHTFIDPAAPPLLRALRERGIRVGILSNTLRSRDWHERVFERDGVLPLIDGAVYSSEIPYTKPHREAFQAALDAVGGPDPAACVFVGDRPYEDVHGSQQLGMRGVLVPHSSVPAWDCTPDAVIAELGELLGHVDRWSA